MKFLTSTTCTFRSASHLRKDKRRNQVTRGNDLSNYVEPPLLLVQLWKLLCIRLNMIPYQNPECKTITTLGYNTCGNPTQIQIEKTTSLRIICTKRQQEQRRNIGQNTREKSLQWEFFHSVLFIKLSTIYRFSQEEKMRDLDQFEFIINALIGPIPPSMT